MGGKPQYITVYSQESTKEVIPQYLMEITIILTFSYSLSSSLLLSNRSSPCDRWLVVIARRQPPHATPNSLKRKESAIFGSLLCDWLEKNLLSQTPDNGQRLSA
jgi:hypothetical protein